MRVTCSAPKLPRAAADCRRARAGRASGTPQAACDDPPDTLCGSIDVPLDRAIRARARSRSSSRWSSTRRRAGHRHDPRLRGRAGVLLDRGGRRFRLPVRAAARPRDLLTIDLRGTGRSGAIDCPDLQHGVGDQVTALRACGDAAGDRGGAVRLAATAPMTSRPSAPRWASRARLLRALRRRPAGRRPTPRAMATGCAPPCWTPRTGSASTTPSSPRWRPRSCARRCSPASARRAATPPTATRRTLRGLLERLRRQPVAGTALDADGQPHHVVVDEARVIDLLADPSGGFLDASEISAAARALQRGDAAPLLRMAAETDFPSFVDQGDPRFYSDGDFAATFCADGVFPFDKSAPEAARRAQYEAAVARCRASAFAPFSVPAWLGSHVATADDCVGVAAPRRARRRPIPPARDVPGRAGARPDRRPRHRRAQRERARGGRAVPARAVRQGRERRARDCVRARTAPAS